MQQHSLQGAKARSEARGVNRNLLQLETIPTGINADVSTLLPVGTPLAFDPDAQAEGRMSRI